MVRLAGTIQAGYDRAICLSSLVADRLIGLISMGLVLPLGLAPALSLADGTVQSFAFSVFLQKAKEFIRRMVESFAVWVKKPGALGGALLAAFGNMIFIYASVYLLLLGIGHAVSIWFVAGLYAITYFVTLVPVSINGLGVQELSMTFLLGGLSAFESATVALLTRLLFLLTSLPGALFLPAILAAMDNQNIST